MPHFESSGRKKILRDYPANSRAKRERAWERCGGVCAYCGVSLTGEVTWVADHLLTRGLGGSNKDGNLVAACGGCNRRKRHYTPEEFRARIRERLEEKLKEIQELAEWYVTEEDGLALRQALSAAESELKNCDIAFAREDLLVLNDTDQPAE